MLASENSKKWKSCTTLFLKVSFALWSCAFFFLCTFLLLYCYCSYLFFRNFWISFTDLLFLLSVFHVVGWVFALCATTRHYSYCDFCFTCETTIKFRLSILKSTLAQFLKIAHSLSIFWHGIIQKKWAGSFFIQEGKNVCEYNP